MTTEKENATLRAINDAMEDLLRWKPLESIAAVPSSRSRMSTC